jgi:hypothetical protein
MGTAVGKKRGKMEGRRWRGEGSDCKDADTAVIQETYVEGERKEGEGEKEEEGNKKRVVCYIRYRSVGSLRRSPKFYRTS